MSTQINKTKDLVLTQAQFNAREQAGTLEEGIIYHIIGSGGGGEPDAYLKSASQSGNTLTLVNKDDTTTTYTPTDAIFIQLADSEVTSKTTSDTNTTYSLAMTTEHLQAAKAAYTVRLKSTKSGSSFDYTVSQFSSGTYCGTVAVDFETPATMISVIFEAASSSQDLIVYQDAIGIKRLTIASSQISDPPAAYAAIGIIGVITLTASQLEIYNENRDNLYFSLPDFDVTVNKTIFGGEVAYSVGMCTIDGIAKDLVFIYLENVGLCYGIFGNGFDITAISATYQYIFDEKPDLSSCTATEASLAFTSNGINYDKIKLSTTTMLTTIYSLAYGVTVDGTTAWTQVYSTSGKTWTNSSYRLLQFSTSWTSPDFMNEVGHTIMNGSFERSTDSGSGKIYINPVTVSATGTSTTEINYLTINGLQYKLPSGGGSGEPSAYLKSASTSGNTLTLTNKDNTTVSYTPDLSSKQDVLTAGNNISISGNTISATDTIYTAGDNITIENNIISATDSILDNSTKTNLKRSLDLQGMGKFLVTGNVTWDGDTTGKETITYSDNTYYKVGTIASSALETDGDNCYIYAKIDNVTEQAVCGASNISCEFITDVGYVYTVTSQPAAILKSGTSGWDVYLLSFTNGAGDITYMSEFGFGYALAINKLFLDSGEYTFSMPDTATRTTELIENGTLIKYTWTPSDLGSIRNAKKLIIENINLGGDKSNSTVQLDLLNTYTYTNVKCCDFGGYSGTTYISLRTSTVSSVNLTVYYKSFSAIDVIELDDSEVISKDTSGSTDLTDVAKYTLSLTDDHKAEIAANKTINLISTKSGMRFNYVVYFVTTGMYTSHIGRNVSQNGYSWDLSLVIGSSNSYFTIMSGMITQTSVSATGTATDEVSYITINGTEKKLAGGSTVSVSSTGTATDGVQYITINDTEKKIIPSSLGYLTTAPTAANTGNLQIVVLSSEPETKYDGYIYFITEA